MTAKDNKIYENITNMKQAADYVDSLIRKIKETSEITTFVTVESMLFEKSMEIRKKIRETIDNDLKRKYAFILQYFRLITDEVTRWYKKEGIDKYFNAEEGSDIFLLKLHGTLKYLEIPIEYVE